MKIKIEDPFTFWSSVALLAFVALTAGYIVWLEENAMNVYNWVNN